MQSVKSQTTLTKPTVVIVAHGNQRSGSFSNPNITIITGAEKPLTFSDAKAYLAGNPSPEYPSSSLGDFGALSDKDCNAIFGKIPGSGPGLVDTGLKVTIRNYPIWVLRGDPKTIVSFAQMGINAKGIGAGKVILLACRSG